jgi:hypothetical protein
MQTLRVLPIALLAVSAAGAQQQPAIHQVGAVAAKSTVFASPRLTIRALPGGRVLVNDLVGRKVVMLDSTLTNATVIADTTAATATAYSGRVGGLIAYRGDSSLFIDPQAMSMLVIDPQGKVGRVMSVPRSQDAMMLTGIQGMPAFDASGRLVYRGAPNFGFARFGPNGPAAPPTPPESAAVVRVDLTTRQLDTVAFVKIPKMNIQMNTDDKGRMNISMQTNPLPVVDEWTVLSDGSIAIVRGRDYHVDWINADGSKVSSAKIPFEWQRLSDEDKVAFIDSVKAARARMAAANPTQAGIENKAAAVAGAAQDARRSGGPQPQGPAADGARRMVVEGGAGEGRVMIAGGPGGAGPNIDFVSPSELPDYKPPFFANAVKADVDGRIWIQTIPTRQIPGGPVYDVIDRKGELVDRVQVPAGRTIVGFGTNGAVYLVSREGTTTTLERASIK